MMPNFFSWSGMTMSPLGNWTSVYPIVWAPNDRWRWWVWSSQWNENWQGKLKYLEKICPSATLSIMDSTWPDLASNLGRCGRKPAANCLICGMAKCCLLSTVFHNFVSTALLVLFPKLLELLVCESIVIPFFGSLVQKKREFSQLWGRSFLAHVQS
jgi:hypothetical protein